MTRRPSAGEKKQVVVLLPEQMPELSPGTARVLLRIVYRAGPVDDDASREGAPETVAVMDERAA